MGSTILVVPLPLQMRIDARPRQPRGGVTLFCLRALAPSGRHPPPGWLMIDFPNHVVPLDAHQRKLTRAIIDPVLPELMADLLDVRRAVDHAFADYHREVRGVPPPNLRLDYAGQWQRFGGAALNRLVRRNCPPDDRLFSNYPKGCCNGITWTVCDVLQAVEQRPQSAALHQLRQFTAAGGVFRVVWGVIRDRYFQTAFQVGAYYVDVANDTVDLAKPRTEHAPLETSGFKNVSSLGEYARIKAAYHHLDVFLNDCVPRALPYHPLIAVDHVRHIVALDTYAYIARLATAGQTEFFQEEAGAPIHRLTDQEIIEELGRPFATGGLFHPLSPEAWTHALATIASKPEPMRTSAAAGARKVVNLVNHLWARSGTYERIRGRLKVASRAQPAPVHHGPTPWPHS